MQIDSSGYFVDDSDHRYEGTSMAAFNLIFVDHDGSVRIKLIRGHDRDSSEYSKNLYNFLNNTSPEELAKVEAYMRSANLITMHDGGTLDLNPVEDRDIINLNMRGDVAEFAGMAMAEVEMFGREAANPLYTIDHNIVYRADSKQFYDAPHITIDYLQEDFSYVDFLAPIEPLKMELEKHIAERFDTGDVISQIHPSEDDFFDPYHQEAAEALSEADIWGEEEDDDPNDLGEGWTEADKEKLKEMLRNRFDFNPETDAWARPH